MFLTWKPAGQTSRHPDADRPPSGSVVLARSAESPRLFPVEAMVQMPGLSVITGAFGFTGRHIALQLLANGERVKTITGRPDGPNAFGDRISVAPFHFDEPEKLATELSGTATLYNTYWIRFNRGEVTFQRAIENTKTLIRAAKDAGVQRLVHISITNPSLDSPYPYFKGKAEVEQAIRESGLSYAIIRPGFVFGEGAILLNNIAWMIRRFPFFVVPGSGEYRVQPIYIKDLARQAVEAAEKSEDMVVDALGPETYSFNEMASLVADAVGGRGRILHLPPTVALFLARLIGWAKNDIALTRDEVNGLLDNMLVSDGPATGTVSLRAWLTNDAVLPALGAEYASELKRNYRR